MFTSHKRVTYSFTDSPPFTISYRYYLDSDHSGYTYHDAMAYLLWAGMDEPSAELYLDELPVINIG